MDDGFDSQRDASPLPSTHRKEDMSERIRLLEETIKTLADRGENYGEVSADFGRAAKLWSSLYEADSRVYEAYEIAMHMICIKLSRLAESPGHRDNWLDIAGYAACGWEAVIEMEREKIRAASNPLNGDSA